MSKKRKEQKKEEKKNFSPCVDFILLMCLKKYEKVVL